MEENERKEEKKQKTSTMSYVFGIFMILIYLGMAYILMFTPIFESRFSPAVRYIVGALFMIYGLFRAYRQIRIKK